MRCHQRIAATGWSAGALALAALWLALPGCGGGGGKAKVTGTVTLDGKPLPAGTIAFIPEKGPAVAASIRDGVYTAAAVPIGDVKVTVETASLRHLAGDEKKSGLDPTRFEKKGGLDPAHYPTNDPKMPAEAKAYFEKQSQLASEAKDMAGRYRPIPDRYTNPETSGLSLTVKSGENKFDVPLTSK